MINGAHVIVSSQDAEADRVFFRGVLGYPHIDAGQGCPVFSPFPGALGLGVAILARRSLVPGRGALELGLGRAERVGVAPEDG